MIDINSKKLVYDQVIEFCESKGIKIKDLHNEIGITDVGFRKTWSKKNPQSIETLNKIIKFMRKYGN